MQSRVASPLDSKLPAPGLAQQLQLTHWDPLKTIGKTIVCSNAPNWDVLHHWNNNARIRNIDDPGWKDGNIITVPGPR